MPFSSIETITTHGAAGYNVGCHCDTCTRAMRLRRQRWRRNLRARRPRNPEATYGLCVFCLGEFNTRGLTTHEARCLL